MLIEMHIYFRGGWRRPMMGTLFKCPTVCASSLVASKLSTGMKSAVVEL